MGSFENMYTTSIVQPCNQGITRTFKACYRTGTRKNVISVIDTYLDQELCTLRAHEIVEKNNCAWMFEFKAWNVVNKITIRYCFRHGSFILGPIEKEEVPIIRSTDLSAEFYNDWINIDAEVQTTEFITDSCGKI